MGELGNLWDNLFDHVYIIWYSKNWDRKAFFEKEFARLDLKNVEIVKTSNPPLKDKMVKTLMNIFWPRFSPQYVSSFDVAFQHYLIWNDVVTNNYQRVLIMEDDVCFLKDIEKVKELLKDFPQHYDIVLLDRVCPFRDMYYVNEQIQENKINQNYFSCGEYLKSNWTAACYSITQNACKFLMKEQEEKGFCPADERLWINFAEKQKLGLKSAYAKKNIAVQNPIFDKDQYHWKYYKQIKINPTEYNTNYE